MQRWYVLQTKPAAESLAEVNLARQGYEVYFPRLVQFVVRGGRRRERVGPLFPRYLFVRVKEGIQPLAPIGSSKGVSGLVRFGARYAIVPDRVVRNLRDRADPETGLHRLRDEADLARGAAVRVIGGPFEGLEGVFEQRAGAERVVVLLTLLGQHARVRLQTHHVVPHHAH
jgi:transcriptional antiterminator RfaH